MTASIRLKPLLISIAIPMIGGYLSSLLSGDMKTTYEALTLPSFAPSSNIFGIVWPILYTMLGIASYLIWQLPDSAARTQALTLYAVQLIMNFIWSPIFFGLQQFQWAFWLCCAILVLAIVTMTSFYMLKPIAAWMMVPYILWLLFAAALNKSVAVLNM